MPENGKEVSRRSARRLVGEPRGLVWELRNGTRSKRAGGLLATPTRGHFGTSFRRFLVPGDHGVADSARKILGVLASVSVLIFCFSRIP